MGSDPNPKPNDTGGSGGDAPEWEEMRENLIALAKQNGIDNPTDEDLQKIYDGFGK